MFYATVLLTKKGPLARVWLSAFYDTKLKKQQIQEADIVVSVDSILDPVVPIALRTSGHLLLGVVKIYSRKVRYLLTDCDEACKKIRTQSQTTTATDLAKSRVDPGSITISKPALHDLSPTLMETTLIYTGGANMPPGASPILASAMNEFAEEWGAFAGPSQQISTIEDELPPMELDVPAIEVAHQHNAMNDNYDQELPPLEIPEPEIVTPEIVRRAEDPEDYPALELDEFAVPVVEEIPSPLLGDKTPAADGVLITPGSAAAAGGANIPPAPEESPIVSPLVAPVPGVTTPLVPGDAEPSVETPPAPEVAAAAVEAEVVETPAVKAAVGKKKRRPMIDKNTELSSDAIKDSLSNTSDIVRVSKMAPQTKRAISIREMELDTPENVLRRPVSEGLPITTLNLFRRATGPALPPLAAPIVAAQVAPAAEEPQAPTPEGLRAIAAAGGSGVGGVEPIAPPTPALAGADVGDVGGDFDMGGADFAPPPPPLDEDLGGFVVPPPADVDLDAIARTPAIPSAPSPAFVPSGGLDNLPPPPAAEGVVVESPLLESGGEPSKKKRKASPTSTTPAAASAAQAVSPDGFSDRTTQLMGMMGKMFDSQPELNYFDLAHGKLRKTVASCFFELLVLKTRDYVDLKQEEPYGNIHITKTAKFDEILGA